jgi:tol-pal system protein YbgF
MKKIIFSMLLSISIMAGLSYAQENPYAAQANIIKNEQAIANLRQQQANLYLKIENLLVKYGELKGRIDDMSRRLESIEAKLNGGMYNHNGDTSVSASHGNVQHKNETVFSDNKKALNTIQKQQSAIKPDIAKNADNKNNNLAINKTQSAQLSKSNAQLKQQEKVIESNTKAEAAKKALPVKDSELFSSARKLYNKKLYSDAIKAFSKIKEQYKDSKYVPDSIFYIAESYFNKKVYDKAIINYDYLINTYPKSSLIPEAILKEGISFINLGDSIDGKYLLKKVIADYPSSNAAQDAKKYLTRIK